MSVRANTSFLSRAQVFFHAIRSRLSEEPFLLVETRTRTGECSPLGRVNNFEVNS
jgi:hypothetical protein